jgi:Asp-tRNA(Asn)/Glu-tRNA(Gln) amidotransferase A subunit family amidase
LQIVQAAYKKPGKRMKKSRDLIAQSSFVGLLAASFLSGCALPPTRPASVTRDRAFIAYWPSPADNKQLTLAVKDNIDVKGVVTTAGSQYVADTGRPASQDAACLAIPRERKVRIVGKTNLSEFAVSPSGVNDYFGTPRNPFSRWLDRRIPGGSSSGSAVAVANGEADVAFGTDTAGSVRVPAASCGVVGLKTTFGLVPLRGVFPVDPHHLDTVGPMARDIAHAAQGMDLLQNGFAARYRRAVAARPAAKNIRIGRLYLNGTDPRVDQAVDRALAEGQFQVVVLGQDFKAKWEQAMRDGNTMAAASTWLSDQQYLDKIKVRPRTKAVIILGRVLYPGQYRQALQRRAEWRRALSQIFKKVDFIALPTLQTLPPTIPLIGNTALLEAWMLSLQNTVAVNFAGNPALAVPIPVKDRHVPVTSLELVGPRLSEAQLLNAGRLIEAEHSGLDREVVSSKTRGSTTNTGTGG